MQSILTERENGTRRLVHDFSDEKSMTEQSHKKKCDINNIMKKYRQTGELPLSSKTPMYGDFSSGETYHEACNLIIEAKEDFMKLPSEIRKRFGNDPGKLVDFLNDPNNLEEAMDLGIIEKMDKPEASGDKPKEERAAEPPREPAPEPSGPPDNG